MTYVSWHVYRQTYFVNSGETLSGKITGKKASDIEERFYRGLVRLQIPSTFRMRITPLGGMTEKFSNVVGEVEIDFVCQFFNRLYPVMIDGEISHYMADWQQEEDAEKTKRVNDVLRPYGAKPVIRVKYTSLANQTMANRVIEEIFSGYQGTDYIKSEKELKLEQSEDKIAQRGAE